ncbi:response regulator transcription factor [Fangia hongkongensis]|uniref:response regulator transcription factor n=1 Tax=Fangia hongkongensis TaxID=270495 RepID=UPI000380D231|nr:response regulator transcription factor [Fangia hongkongensis]MBK2125685.1 response regulator transcription factor [Fangia hongkongensis]
MCSKFAYFEKDAHGRLININDVYLKYLGHKNIDRVIGRQEVEISELRPFHKLYSIGEREVHLFKGISIHKELFYFNDVGIQPIITTRHYVNQDDIYIKGFFFKLHESPTVWDGKNLIILNYFRPVKLSLLKFYVLSLRCRGVSNLEIANYIFRAESTVRNIIQGLYTDFEVYDFVTLARYFNLGQWLNETSLSLLDKRFGLTKEPPKESTTNAALL